MEKKIINSTMAEDLNNLGYKNTNEMLEKIGELYFKNNKIELKCNSSFYMQLHCFFVDFNFAFFNPISIIINITFVASFLIFINKTLLTSILFWGIFIIVLTFEYGIFVPAYCRITSSKQIKTYYRLIASRLINILTPRLHYILCNSDGTVKDFVSSVATPVFCKYLGTEICSQFGITSEIIQLIILFLVNRELKNFCSIVPPSMSDDELQLKLQMLKEEMEKIKKDHNRKK